MTFEKLFSEVKFNSRDNILLLGAEALKAETNSERLSIVTLLFKSNDKVLISLCVCDFLIKKSKEYLQLIEKLICYHFASFYQSVDQKNKTKIRAILDTWHKSFSVDVFNKLKSSTETIDLICDSDTEQKSDKRDHEEEDDTSSGEASDEDCDDDKNGVSLLSSN